MSAGDSIMMERQSLRADDVARRARALVKDLKRLAPEAEALRRVPDESLRLVRDAQLLAVLQTRACGGHELTMRAHLDVVSALAEGCTATAWVVGVGHAHSWMIAHLPAQAQQDVYGDGPDVLVAGVIGPRGRAVEQADGGYILDGQWPFGSGSQHAAWLLLGAQVTDRDGRPAGEADFLVPAAAVTINDDWFVAGLQGTGSCSITGKGVAVPAHRKLSLGGLIERNLPNYGDGAPGLTKSQAVPVLALCLCGPALGAARAALAEFLRMVPGKKVMYTPHLSQEWIPNQVVLGHAASLIHAAELVLYRVADEIDDHAARDASMSDELRGRIRMDCSLAVRFCLEAVDKLFMNGGASGLSLASPLQRAARDLRAINMHGLLLLDASAEIYGRIQLGLRANSPIY
jgi:3-hydroxy-9,10-secoandrosta-1,3,5(10)-triene-9,17-dione monooxygenase